MKLGEIRKKFEHVKSLLKELSMLEALTKAMLRSKKEQPDELPINEEYFDNVVKRQEKIKKELENIFK